jgi:uncharacterized protein (DUF608 family)
MQGSAESVSFKGLCTPVGGFRLYHLKMMKHLAEQMGDIPFADQCQDWYEQIIQLMDEYLWNESYYILFNDLETGEVAKEILSYQLDGEFMAWYDGLKEGAFPPHRVKSILAKLKETCTEEWGMRMWSNPDGSAVNPEEFDPGYWSVHGVHAPSALMLAMTYMYHDEMEFGLEVARRVMENMICKQGWTWDMPILFSGDTGEGIWGNDYAQMMMCWALPAAVKGKDLVDFSSENDELVNRVIRAASNG